ncbi:hypothetical protein INT45_007021 [Circinella minor]|uniref:Arrestin C-terminal-like domain-containing protein n=1 Tax=Circinella minor TaxID=1195481 RepID=A0A8H7VJX3_9FUNG|nr:hypothetical protein INT45_007021 [Circinella minor]
MLLAGGMLLTKNKKTKEFYIDLQDNRYYNPGETVRGDVVLDLAKATKINHIRVTLAGVVQVGANNLTLFNRECQIATAPDESGNTHQLEARSNRFPFELSIPGEGAELPTSMKLTQQSGVKYTLSAVLKMPFTFVQSWSPQDTREISIVEKIDVGLPEYAVKARVDEQIRFQENTAVVSMHIPKVAFVRGDILPVTAIIKHYKFFEKPKAVTISLMRRFHLFNKGKIQLIEQRIIKKPRIYDLALNIDNEYRNEFVAKIFIPQSVAPSTASSGRILRVDYVAHIAVDLNKVNREDPQYQESHGAHMDIPVIIGTTPKAEVSIDDEETDDEEETVSDENPELSKDIENLKLNDGEGDEKDHDGITNNESSFISPPPYLSRDNSTATRQSVQLPAYVSQDNSVINSSKRPSPPDHQISRNSSFTSTNSSQSRHNSVATLSRDNSLASNGSSRKSVGSEPTSSLSRDNSLASTASKRSIINSSAVLSRENSLASVISRKSTIAEVHESFMSRNDSLLSTASNDSASRRSTTTSQDNNNYPQQHYHSGSNSQHSSSYFPQQSHHTLPQQLQRDESFQSTASHHTSSSNSSPYISPSTSSISQSTHNNNLRVSMPIVMPAQPPSHGNTDEPYNQFPRNQSPSNMSMPMPMPHQQQQYHHPHPSQTYSTSPNNHYQPLYSSSPNNNYLNNQPHASHFPHHYQQRDHPPPTSGFDTHGGSISMPMPMPIPGGNGGPHPHPHSQQWPTSNSSFHNNPPYPTNDSTPPPPNYW